MKLLSLLRKVGPTALLCTGLAASINPCFGNSMTIGSSATDTTNDSGAPTLDIDPNPLWATAMPGSSWVSYTQSGNPGSGFVSPPNGTAFTFTQAFMVGGTPTSGSLAVMADDSASVMLNGMMLAALAPAASNSYFVCSDYTIGCLPKTTATVDLMSGLHSGWNTLSFTVVQSNSVSYGLDYSANVSFTPSITSVPEPGTLALFGVPLVALSLARRRNKNNKK